MKPWVIAITGASGVCYGISLLRKLAPLVPELHVIFSDAALRVLQDEENLKTTHGNLKKDIFAEYKADNVIFYNPRDIGARVASGSMISEGMVIVPCSMATLGAIANGVAQNLIHRAAEVAMKEGRRLIVVPRETPLATVHLENMLKLSRMGVQLVPAMPGFYHQPTRIDEVVDMMVMKILDQMGIHTELVKRWQGH